MDVVSRGADITGGAISVTMGDECGFDIDMDILFVLKVVTAKKFAMIDPSRVKFQSQRPPSHHTFHLYATFILHPSFSVQG
jgi:hypothetical protein